MVSASDVEENTLKLIRDVPKDVTLVAVTKTVNSDDIRRAVEAGITDIAENKVQEALDKYPLLKDLNIRWHLVGRLQTNKVKKSLEIFDLIHSVDSLKLADFINREALKIGKVQKVLLQVNISKEETKGGFYREELIACLKEFNSFDNLDIKGLMTIGTNTIVENDIRACFHELKQLKEEINGTKYLKKDLYILSMGMSNDYKIAIEEGSTLIRVGRAIFGNRK